MSDHDETRNKDEEEKQKRVLLSKGKDEAFAAFKARIKAAVREAGILPDEGPRDAEDRDRRPG